MRNFKKILLRFLLIVLFIVLIDRVGHYLYESVGDNTYFTIDELKEVDGTIETLLLGTSLMQRGMDPAIISETLDTTCFNLASSAQPIAGSYYLLKDQINRSPIERVFMGVSVKSFVSDEDSKSTTSKLRAFDLIRSPLIKWQFLTEIAEPGEYERFLFFPARVEKVVGLSAMIRNVKYRQTAAYQNRISYPGAPFEYYGMGFQSNVEAYDGSQAKNVIPETSVWAREKILDENISYLKKMAELCQENNVELNIVVFPHVEDYATKQGNLADMDDYLRDFCTEIGANLYNYNYTARPDIYRILPNEYFMDRKHLNTTGAAQMAGMLCQDYQK